MVMVLLRAVLGDTFSYGNARKAGVSDKRLYRLRDHGDIVALGGGVYPQATARRNDPICNRSPTPAFLVAGVVVRLARHSDGSGLAV